LKAGFRLVPRVRAITFLIRRIMMRRAVLFGFCVALVFGGACQEQVTEPTPTGEVATTSVAMGSVATPALRFDRSSPLGLSSEKVLDAFPIDIATDRAINGDDYVCDPNSPIFDVFDDAIEAIVTDPEEFAIALFLLNDLFAADVVQLEVLIFLEESREVQYGYNGEFTDQLNRSIKALRRFWDIPSSNIHVVPMKGSMLQDAERISTVYQSPLAFGLSESDADFFAGVLVDALSQSVLLDGGNHPLFSFNAFAFAGIPALGLPPKLAMGDAIMNGFADLGFGDVAPQGILAHEWAHHVQFVNDYFSDPVPSLDPPANAAEMTRYTELMADAMAAYFLTHKRGAAMNQKRVEQFLEVYFQIGDCSFASPSHHGTPNQRMAAARFGFDVAAAAQVQGDILASEAFHDLFVAEYLNLIAPDA
jgi:hypothetical protein